MTSKTGRPSFSDSTSALLAVPYSVTPGESRNFDLATSSYAISTGSSADPPYLFLQLKSEEWLRRYGLKSQKLTFDQILQQIGFKRVESFDPVIGKTVTAKYAGNLYHEVQHDNGDRYVLTCRPEKLREYHQRLIRMLDLLRKRLVFITNGSRRLFGIIGEPSVCLVCDCKTLDHRIFNQFQSALTSLFKEQISKIKRFNVIWVSDDNQQFREQPIDANSTNIDQAIDWICDKKCPRNKVSLTSTCEAVLKAFNNNAHSIYLISEGDSSDVAREMLRDNIVKMRLSSDTSKPLHVVSLFSQNNDTQMFLRSIAQSADGSYFCYKIKNEISDLKAPSNLSDPTRIKLQDDKLQVGTNALTSLPEYPLDITLMYKEVIQCQNIIDRLEKILGFIKDENQNPVQSFDSTKSVDAFNVSGENNFQRSLLVQSSTLFNHEENDMPSSEWVKIYGIDAQKLDFFSVLQSAAFRHCDGVVTLLKPPDDAPDKTEETPANPQDKLVNAIYCDQFAHVAWPDGTIRHVHVTPELYRDYERRLKALLEKIKSRLTYLKKGSRDVFGTILENNIYILIDTSKSMQHHLGFVKEKLRQLIQDQLSTKERINMVAFNSIVNPWRDRLTKVNDSSTYSQLQPWIDGLNTDGSTNTLAALRFALADPATEAIYLLTDGRPDQNERHILSQVQYRQSVPIHTIAFNCQDQTANQFLYDLAKQTGGRFHAFKYGFEKETSIEIPESEDVGNLKREQTRGEKELKRIAALRDECLGKAWSSESIPSKSSKYRTRQSSQNSLPPQLRSQSTLDVAFRPSSAAMPQRPNKKKRLTTNPKLQRRSQSVTNLAEQNNIFGLNPNQWLLPETKEFLSLNDKREKSRSDTEDEQPREVTQIKPKKISTPFDEVKWYLKKNSLVAKGLTIFDVLHPTTVNVREPRYIQVIDRYVLSKVWDDILPLAYGSYVGKLRLVNHYAVNLEEYEKNLKELITDYHQFVVKFISKHLSEEDKRKFGSITHWNRLSQEEKNQINREITKEEHISESDFAWRKLTDDEQNESLRKTLVYQNDDKAKFKNALKESESKSALKGVERMDVEIQRAIKFLQISTDLRQLQKRADVDSKPPKPDSPPKVRRKSPLHVGFGQRIICRFDADGFFYPGVIKKNHRALNVISFDMGIEQEAVGHILLPTNGAIAQPNLFCNDYVLVRQTNRREEFWAPGIVTVLPPLGARPPPLYTVHIYMPTVQRAHVCRRDLLKISLALFQRIVLYLQHLNRIPPSPEVITVDPGAPVSFEDTLRKQLKPLKSQIKKLEKSHGERYDELKKSLEDQMHRISALQERNNKDISGRDGRKTDDDPDGRGTDDDPNGRGTGGGRGGSKTDDDPNGRGTGGGSPLDGSEIPDNTNVYAVWSDDDWFVYTGIVLGKDKGRKKYIVERSDYPRIHHDNPRISSFIARDNIYLKTDLEPLETLDSKSFALIQCLKDFRRCWRPAVILGHDERESEVSVRFYDCIDKNLPYNELVIPITRKKFECYSTARILYEKQLLGQAIVGLNETEHTFMLGTVKDRKKSGHRYVIEWCNKKDGEQEEEYLFGSFTRRIKPELNDFVLAVDDNVYLYKPAKVIQISRDEKTLTVVFQPPAEKTRAEVAPETTFVITEAYYKSIKNKLIK